MSHRTLSTQAIRILQLLSIGQTHEQIVNVLGCQLGDINGAAAEALRVCGDEESLSYSVAGIRQTHPRAYQPWASEEEAQLTQLKAAGKTIDEIANLLQRQPSAIRSRLERLAEKAVSASACIPYMQPRADLARAYPSSKASLPSASQSLGPGGF